MLYPFNALLARMKYITRWSLMHSTRAESLSEHTCDTALLAHTLCLIARRYTGTPCRPKTVAVAALYHDAPEIITGDLPTPVKYHSATLRDAYKAMERESVASMTAMLPDELAEEVAPFLTGELLTAEEAKLLKAADRLSAWSSAWKSSAAATTSLTRHWPSRKPRWKPCTARRPTGSWPTACPATPRIWMS